jgi:hypothetical protein
MDSWNWLCALGGSELFAPKSVRQGAYKQPATLRFEVFTCGAILGHSGHHLVLHMAKHWVATHKESRSSTTSYIGLRQLLRNLVRQQKMPHDFQLKFEFSFRPCQGLDFCRENRTRADLFRLLRRYG